MLQDVQGYENASAGYPCRDGDGDGAGIPQRRSSLPRASSTTRLVVITPVARSIAGFVCIWIQVPKKMLQSTHLPWWPATPPPSELLTAPSGHRSSSQTAFHHSHPEHMRVVQMVTLACLPLHPYDSNILFLGPDSNRLMLTASSSHLTALFSIHS